MWPASWDRPSERSSIAFATLREAAALLEPKRRTNVATVPEGRAGRAERPGHDEQVARPRA